MNGDQNMTYARQDDNHRFRRLIEVDLPIKRISAHAQREKSIRHGHISTLHVWWARRPLGACRAVICATLWLDPADPACPAAFRVAAAEVITGFARRIVSERPLAESCSPQAWGRWKSLVSQGSIDTNNPSHLDVLQGALLDFIADFSSWENSTVDAYLETSRVLTAAAHAAVGGAPGSRPLVADPFAGGGSIPLEALRVGADAFASDVNPVAALLNKVILEYMPRYGQRLADEVRTWGEWVTAAATEDLSALYPSADAESVPVAYLWARTIRCEGPECGAEVPLLRSLWLAKRGTKSIALRIVADRTKRSIDFEIRQTDKPGDGTVKRGSVTCPVCHYTTSVAVVRRQLKEAEGGADSSRLIAVALRSASQKTYRLPQQLDHEAVEKSRAVTVRGDIIAPTELPLMSGVFNVPLYGITRWDLLFSSRQLYSAKILMDKINLAYIRIVNEMGDADLASAVRIVLMLNLDKYLDFRTTLCAWISVGEKIGHTFGRQALGMIFDWTEGVPFGDISGSWDRSLEYIVEFIEREARAHMQMGTVSVAAAQNHPLPDDSVQAFVTDPPYYNSVPYADLSDFFYAWLRKSLADSGDLAFSEPTAPKAEELCEMRGWDPIRYPHKDASFYESGMREALSEGRRITSPDGVGVVVFAHKTTAGWESLLSALVGSGWIVTASWPIDTERAGRLRAMHSAVLTSSVHLVCRPRERVDGSGQNSVGDWRDVLEELPLRIHSWMPRLASEGVVGADAIFACLGPSLEIFSRYERVEKSSGEKVELTEYLEHVWAAVAREGLSMIFSGADATGMEEDARLTAMWLWTVAGGSTIPSLPYDAPVAYDESTLTNDGQQVVSDDDEMSGGSKSATTGFSLEFDAARKISQGLGAHLDRLGHVVEVKGDTARLLSVAERTQYLFGKDGATTTARASRRSAKLKQLDMFGELAQAEEETSFGIGGIPVPGRTILDKVHQAMILFGAGRADGLRRFLVELGVGQEPAFWSLAQSLSALYPTGTDEKRWVDGVLARKRGLGF